MRTLQQRKRIVAGASIVLVAWMVSTASADPNRATAREGKAGFKTLFDGSGLEGWEQKGNWVVEDGAVFRARRGGGITYKAMKVPNDFELCFDWKVAQGSNSGVYYRPGQYEYQILDNKRHPNGRNPRTTAASLYFCVAPSQDATRPPGKWNTGRVICKGTVIQHWLNGKKVVDIDYSDPKWAANVELLRLRGADLSARGAYVHLQDHGDPVWYRSIRLRPLGTSETLDRSPITPQPISDEIRQAERKKIEHILEQHKRRAKAGK